MNNRAPKMSDPSQAILFKEILNNNEQNSLEKLLGDAFKVPKGSSFYDDFPVWNRRLGAKIVQIGAFSGNDLVASASGRLANLKVPTGTLPIGIVGGVVTETEWRGKGLASSCVSQVLTWLQSNGAAFALLWGSEHSLYRRLGFELCGSQIRIPLKDLSGEQINISQINIRTGWTDFLFDRLKQRQYGLALTDKDRSWFSAHKNVVWWWVGEEHNIQAYAAVGRGIDLGGLVHEWGGERTALLALLKKIQATNPGLELLGTPSVFTQYMFNYSGYKSEHLCMAKVFDVEKTLKTHIPGKTITLPDNLSELEIVQALFGPDKHQENLPLPLWIWGLDAA